MEKKHHNSINDAINDKPKSINDMTPCITFTPSSIAPSDPTVFPAAEIKQINDCLDASIALIEARISSVTIPNNRRSVTQRSIGAVQQAIGLAQQHPNTVASVINIDRWIDVLNRATILDPTIQKAEVLIASAMRYERTFGMEAFQFFGLYYRCVRQLSADGVIEAQMIYGVLSELYARFFGPRGPHKCPEELINSTLNAAHKVIVANKDKVIPIMKEQKFLEEKLEHDIHDNVELIDGHFINRDYIKD